MITQDDLESVRRVYVDADIVAFVGKSRVAHIVPSRRRPAPFCGVRLDDGAVPIRLPDPDRSICQRCWQLVIR